MRGFRLLRVLSRRCIVSRAARAGRASILIFSRVNGRGNEMNRKQSPTDGPNALKGPWFPEAAPQSTLSGGSAGPWSAGALQLSNPFADWDHRAAQSSSALATPPISAASTGPLAIWADGAAETGISRGSQGVNTLRPPSGQIDRVARPSTNGSGGAQQILRGGGPTAGGLAERINPAAPPPPPPDNALSIEQYLKLVGQVEQFYKDQSASTGKTYDSNQAVSGMRAIYGYEGGNWEQMIPNAPDVKPPCSVKGGGDSNAQEGDPATCDPMKAVIKQLFSERKNDKGEIVKDARLVRLPNGDLIDPGHLYTGIDSHLHPEVSGLMGSYGIDNRDGSTWSGDVGSAIVRHKESKGSLSEDQAMEAYASKADLNSDLDGYNLGHGYNRGKSLTEQLSSYYLPPEKSTSGNDYRTRYSQFINNRGIGAQSGKITGAGKNTIQTETDDFAEAYDRRSSKMRVGWGAVFGSDEYEPSDGHSKPMTDRFINYLETGLASEKRP